MLTRFFANAAALAVATWLIPGIWVSGTTWQARAGYLALVAVVFGLLNALIKPIFEFATGCLIMLTLGLFIWVINAAMLRLTSTVCAHLGIGWRVDGWTPAFWGALIVSFVSSVLGWALKRREDAR